MVERTEGGIEEEAQGAGRGMGDGGQAGVGAGADVAGAVCLRDSVQAAGVSAVGGADHRGERLKSGDGEGGAGRGQDRYDRQDRIQGVEERGGPGASGHHRAGGAEGAGGGVEEVVAGGRGGEGAGWCADHVR